MVTKKLPIDFMMSKLITQRSDFHELGKVKLRLLKKASFHEHCQTQSAKVLA